MDGNQNILKILCSGSITIAFSKGTFKKLSETILKKLDKNQRKMIENIKLQYVSDLYALKRSSFEFKNRKISFSKAFDMLTEDYATLLIEGISGDLKFQIKDNQMILSMNETIFIQEDNQYQLMILLCESFNGNVSIRKIYNDHSNIVILYKDGLELNNIECRHRLAEKLYTQYKVEVYNLYKINELSIYSTVKKNRKMITVENPLIATILRKGYENGFNIKVDENDLFYKNTFIVKNINLKEIILNSLSVTEIESLKEISKMNHSKLKEFQNFPYITKHEIDVNEAINKIFKPTVNINKIYRDMYNQQFLINIKQVEDDIYIEFYKDLYEVNKANIS